MSEKLYRDFDDPERYEREKVTRIMPGDLHKLGIYTLRMMWPPDTPPPFAAEFLTCILDVEQTNTGYYRVGYCWQPKGEPESADTVFNAEGFMVMAPEELDEIEMGYFVGSLDPYDIEFADLVAKAKELSPA